MIDFKLIADFFNPEIATVLISMLPIVELRGAIPVAIGLYDLPVWDSFYLSVIGNMIPVFFIVFFLEKVGTYLQSKYLWAQKFFNWLYKRSLRKFDGHYNKYGLLGIFLFVAIPLPMTGVWTASIASYLLGLKSRVVIPYMLAGVLVAGLIVTGISIGVFR